MPPLTWNCTTAGFLGCRRDSLYCLICVSFVKRHLVLRDTDNELLLMLLMLLLWETNMMSVAHSHRERLLHLLPALQFGKIDIGPKIRGSLCRILCENILARSAVQKKYFFLANYLHQSVKALILPPPHFIR